VGQLRPFLQVIVSACNPTQPTPQLKPGTLYYDLWAKSIRVALRDCA
jgi:hypothetical protein